MAAKAQRRPKPLSNASFFFGIIGALFASLVVVPAVAKSAPPRSRVPYSEPTPAEGGKTATVSFWLVVVREREKEREKVEPFFPLRLTFLIEKTRKIKNQKL